MMLSPSLPSELVLFLKFSNLLFICTELQMPTSRSQKRKLLLLTAILAHKRGLLIPRVRMKRRWPIRPINQYRKQFGRFHNTLKVMLKQDPEEFYKYTRLYVEEFTNLVSLLAPILD